MNKTDLLQKLYNTSAYLSIYTKGRNNNDLQILSYTNDMVTFLKGTKKIEIPMDDFTINVDYSEKIYRDIYCKEKVGMTFEQLQSLIEDKVSRKDPDVDVTQIGYKYGLSSAKRIIVTVNGLELVAAMTYGTVTGIRFPDGVIVEQKYSVTSSQWQNRIL
jgi:hypothetical protein